MGSDREFGTIESSKGPHEVWLFPFTVSLWLGTMYLGFCFELNSGRFLDLERANLLFWIVAGWVFSHLFSLGLVAPLIRAGWRYWFSVALSILGGAVVLLIASGIGRNPVSWVYQEWLEQSHLYLSVVFTISDPYWENAWSVAILFFFLGFVVLFSLAINRFIFQLALGQRVTSTREHQELGLPGRWSPAMTKWAIGLALLVTGSSILTASWSPLQGTTMAEFGLLAFLLTGVSAGFFAIAARLKPAAFKGLLLLLIPAALWPIAGSYDTLFGDNSKHQHFWFGIGFCCAHTFLVTLWLGCRRLPCRAGENSGLAFDRTRDRNGQARWLPTILKAFQMATLLLLFYLAYQLPMIYDVPVWLSNPVDRTLPRILATARQANGGSFSVASVDLPWEYSPVKQGMPVIHYRGSVPLILTKPLLRERFPEAIATYQNQAQFRFEPTTTHVYELEELLSTSAQSVAIHGRNIDSHLLNGSLPSKSKVILVDTMLDNHWLDFLANQSKIFVHSGRFAEDLDLNSHGRLRLVVVWDTVLTDELLDRLTPDPGLQEKLFFQFRVHSANQLKCQARNVPKDSLVIEGLYWQVQTILSQNWSPAEADIVFSYLESYAHQWQVRTHAIVQDEVSRAQLRAWSEESYLHRLSGDYQKAVDLAEKVLAEDDSAPDLNIHTGSCYFMLGQMDKAIKKYDRAIELDPKVKPQLWQRGLTLYYLGRYQDGQLQFESHQTYNTQDVENAVWHMLCQAKAKDLKTARESLIAIDRDTRVPMKEIHQLYAGQATVEDVIAAAEALGSSWARKEALYYAHLYIGLYYEMTGKPQQALASMEEAEKVNPLFEKYLMGKVAKVHLQLRKAEAEQNQPEGKEKADETSAENDK